MELQGITRSRTSISAQGGIRLLDREKKLRLLVGDTDAWIRPWAVCTDQGCVRRTERRPGLRRAGQHAVRAGSNRSRFPRHEAGWDWWTLEGSNLHPPGASGMLCH